MNCQQDKELLDELIVESLERQSGIDPGRNRKHFVIVSGKHCIDLS